MLGRPGWRIHDDECANFHVKFNFPPKKAPSSVSNAPKSDLTKRKSSVKDSELKFGEEEVRVKVAQLVARGYRPTNRIACGAFGCVYDTESSDDGGAVLKLGLIEGFEVQLAVRAAMLGIGPQIYNAFPCELAVGKEKAQQLGSAYVMQKLGPSLHRIIDLKEIAFGKREFIMLFDLAKRCIRAALLHDDLHLNNILATINADGQVERFYVIDWGYAGRTVASIYVFLSDPYPDSLKYVRIGCLRRVVYEWSKILQSVPSGFSFNLVSSAANPLILYANEQLSLIGIPTDNIDNLSDVRDYIRPFITRHRTFDTQQEAEALDVEKEIAAFDAETRRLNDAAKLLMSETPFKATDHISLRTERQRDIWMTIQNVIK